ncbi:sideroflexin-4 [Plectropomus leopardus]|uniref:sideroflexin-4 n=1 Tax=Plectropomus leopardus TaxID=160734 RepID=UPI001C4B3D33|nr:sideroflexin-4 [Plectropomus leopardus]
MDPNLLYWKKHGQTFFSRFQHWFFFHDPLILFSSDREIIQAHAALGRGEHEDSQAVQLSLSSFQADSGHVIPLYVRPAALFYITSPVVLATALPHFSVGLSLVQQFALHHYLAAFNLGHRNCSTKQREKERLNPFLLITGTASLLACIGALPHVFIKGLNIRSGPSLSFLRLIVPIPLSAALAFLNVSIVRREETKLGIQVFDANGNPVGHSKAAGEKAVRETALSRAALFGTTTAVPNLVMLFLKRRSQILSKQGAFLHLASAGLSLTLMIPVSFSLFPTLGTIKRENVEEQLQASATDGLLYYHRGL